MKHLVEIQIAVDALIAIPNDDESLERPSVTAVRCKRQSTQRIIANTSATEARQPQADDRLTRNIGRLCRAIFAGRRHRQIFVTHERQKMSESTDEDSANLLIHFLVYRLTNFNVSIAIV